MMLMTKFGNFKLRIVATIPLSVIVCILNLVSASTSYWVKYMDNESNGVPHIAGLWRSCPANQQGFVNCMWKNGIVSGMHSMWAVCVRVFMGVGLIGNVVAVVCFCCACYYKTIKRSKMTIKMMEWGNMLLICSFMAMLVGFSTFISNHWNYSMWFHMAGMCLITVCCNMLVRTFGRLYFMHARGGCAGGPKKTSGGVETCCVAGTAEEKTALTQSAVCDKETCTPGNGELQMTAIEMNKICEKNGSNEALLPNASATASVQPAVNLTEASPVKPVAAI